MLLARLFSKVFKKSGVILIDYRGQKYICGSPNFKKPLTVKLLKQNLFLKFKVRELAREFMAVKLNLPKIDYFLLL